jgi:hypothetical protein
MLRRRTRLIAALGESTVVQLSDRVGVDPPLKPPDAPPRSFIVTNLASADMLTAEGARATLPGL